LDLKRIQADNSASTPRRPATESSLTFGLGLLSPDNPVVAALIFGLALLSGCGFLGGLYLLLRVLV
jgi:hypothetical protein